MKKLNRILIFAYILLDFAKAQCLGDLNSNYHIEETDLNIFSM